MQSQFSNREMLYIADDISHTYLINIKYNVCDK